ncbi:LytR/AlgR family response regulator transcription factor [Marinoscillum sp.]|uniref:LytR/AlgR family response regulator transcription factor n=1 Tax=Marinoscillum sp. TaxID=2024838 RepID=UPI003BAA534A
MTSIKVLIIEDDPIICQDLSEMLANQGMDVVGVAPSFEMGLELFHSRHPDVMLVDIKLRGEKTGVDLVNHIKSEIGINLPVVYLTANSDPTTKSKAFKSEPSSFLTKPYHEQDLVNALELSFERRSSTEQSIFVKHQDKYIKINQFDIVYLKADGSYCRIVTRENSFLVSVNLNKSAAKLQESVFLRIHRSFIVNRSSIEAVDKNHIFLKGISLPIGRKYKDDVFKAMEMLP